MQRTRLLSVLVVGVAAVAVVATDIAVIPHRSHEIAVRQAAKRRAAYLEAVRPSLTQVYVALRPLEDAVADQASDDTDGIDFPVRDVLAHNTGTTTFAAAATAFDKVAPPKDLKASATSISGALHRLATDTHGFATLATADGQTLADAFLTGTFENLSNDVTALNDSLTKTYGAEGRTPPRLPSSAPPSHDSWLFGVDLACLAGEKQLEGRVDTDNETLAQDESDLAISVAAGRATNAAVRKVAVPASDAKATALVKRLVVLDRAVAAQSAILAALRAENPSALDAAEAQNAGVLADLAAVGTAFQAYGATECGTFYGVKTSSSSGSGGSGSGSGPSA